MKYYFVQHGKALSGDIDETRPLSEEGKSETHAIAVILGKNNIRPSAIFHSGKLRAAQTAEIIAGELDIGSCREREGMKPNDDILAFINTLSSGDANGTMYVGHLPQLQKVVSYLLTKDETSNSVIFQNSAVVCVDVQDDDPGNRSSILWVMTPSTI